MRNGELVARNFVERYGADRFARLLRLMEQNESGQCIADEFEVSRERVRQWKNAFGKVVTLYQVHADVAAILREEVPLTADRPR